MIIYLKKKLIRYMHSKVCQTCISYKENRVFITDPQIAHLAGHLAVATLHLTEYEMYTESK